MAQIAFSVATWKFCRNRVLILHRRSLLQHAVVYCDLFPVLLLGFRCERVFLVATVIFSSTYSFSCDRSFFGSLTLCLANSVILTILCRNNLMCGSWNSYVATSTIALRQCFLCSFFKLVLRSGFYVATAFLFGSCCNDVYCIVSISVATRKVCRNRVLSPLNLISCCSFILILRHSLLVLSMFALIIATWKSLLRQKKSFKERPLSLQGNVCRDTEKRNIYRDKVMYVATLKEEEMLVATDKQGRDM